MSEWPLHVTMADAFTVDITDELMVELRDYTDNTLSAVTYVEKQSILGETPVWILSQTKELQKTHNDIVSILERHGAIFNTPDLTREGFIPHITKTKANGMKSGDKIVISTLSLIDMFPNQNWKERRVIRSFGSR